MKLPAYYEKYFDEKFDNVEGKLDNINDHLKELNSSAKKNHTRSTDNSRKIKMLAVALVAGSFVWIKESRDTMIHVFKLFLGL